MDIVEAIVSALDELHLAQDSYRELEAEQRQASSRATAALNRLNTAQKRVDEHLNRLKENAPTSTDWKREKGRYVA